MTSQLQLPRIRIVEPPTAYCDIHGDLSEGVMEKKQCKAKECPHLSFVKLIIRWKE